MPCIEVKELTHAYFTGTPLQVVALRDINLEVLQGEFLALAGATGSGKTTLVQHLNGLLLPTSGQVKVLGRNVNEHKHRNELWRRVGLVFQYPERQIFNTQVYDDIAFGVRNMGLSKEAVSERVNEALSIVGLSEDIKNIDPRKLSGGVLRRVAIAGVLAMHPEVLILDEPGAGLDPAARQSILKNLKKLQKNHGTTVILITHYLEDVAVYADRVAVLYKGQMLSIGSPGYVLRQYSLLMDAGLKPPYAVELAYQLAQKGINLPEVPLTNDDTARILNDFNFTRTKMGNGL